MAERYPLLLTQRRVLPVAVAFALVGVFLWQPWWARAGCALLAALTAGMAWWQARARPTLVLDEHGYAVEERGREKLRVAWSEVVRVRADAAEHALYVDCGDPSRNLLVPPRRGYGYRFDRAPELYARVLERVGDRVEAVARLDAAPQKK